MREISIRDLYKQTEKYVDQEITLEAWVKTLRDSKMFK